MIAAAAGALWWRTRTRQQSAERLAAATLEALLNAIDANDAVTGAHLRRTAAYALILADAAGLSESCRHSIERVALFHDIGKIDAALFDIVHDDAKLTPEDRAAIATHPQRGADVLRPLARFYPELPNGVLSHHEHWDGTGYPRRLRGPAIPLVARVVAIADTFDALTHNRPYHRGESADRAAEILTEGRGTQFDPALVDLFLSPPVFARVQQRMGADQADSPRPPSVERRGNQHETDVPDVRFRWQGSEAAP